MTAPAAFALPRPAPAADQAGRLRLLAPARVAPELGDTKSGAAVDAGAPMVVVASGKGGVGKTTIAANLAAVFAARRFRSNGIERPGGHVTLIDGDEGTANADILLGIPPGRRATRRAAVNGYDAAADVQRRLVATPFGFDLLPAASGFGPNEARRELIADSTRTRWLPARVHAVRRRSSLVVFDAGAGVGPGVLMPALAADAVIVVMTPERASIADAYALVKTLVSLSSGATSAAAHMPALCLVVNRVAAGRSGERDARGASERFVATADRFLDVRIRLLGLVADSSLVRRAGASSQLFVASRPRRGVSLAVRRIAEDVAAELPEPSSDSDRPNQRIMAGIL